MTRTKAALPNLTLPEMHAALSYYYPHKAEKDKEWQESLRSGKSLWRRLTCRP